jgi:hypothetical protein
VTVEILASRDAGIPAEEPRPSRRPLVLAAVVGFVIGSSLIGILWAVSGPHAGANDDAVAACAALARTGPLPVTAGGDGQVTATTLLATGVVDRIIAARELAAAAAAANSDYQELADHIDGVSRMVISLHFNDPAGHRHLELARQICART